MSNIIMSKIENTNNYDIKINDTIIAILSIHACMDFHKCVYINIIVKDYFYINDILDAIDKLLLDKYNYIYIAFTKQNKNNILEQELIKYGYREIKEYIYGTLYSRSK